MRNSALQTIIGTCICLVCMTVIATFATLFNNIRANRKDYVLKNTNNMFGKLFSKVFCTSLQKSVKQQNYVLYKVFEKTKLVISNNYTFFYDTTDLNSDRYVAILSAVR